MTARPADPPRSDPGRRRRFGWSRRSDPSRPTPVEPTRPLPVDVTAPISPPPDDGPMAPPGYTLYRPSGLDRTRRLDENEE
jgi:hypothetical protein